MARRLAMNCRTSPLSILFHVPRPWIGRQRGPGAAGGALAWMRFGANFSNRRWLLAWIAPDHHREQHQIHRKTEDQEALHGLIYEAEERSTLRRSRSTVFEALSPSNSLIFTSACACNSANRALRASTERVSLRHRKTGRHRIIRQLGRLIHALQRIPSASAPVRAF